MNRRKMLVVLAASITVLAASCASNAAPATYTQNERHSATAQASAEARKTADLNRVLDWANRGLSYAT